jgi:RimJ/RimL family protein N-acetyltransferase
MAHLALRAEGARVHLRPVSDSDHPVIGSLHPSGRGEASSETAVIADAGDGRAVGVLDYRLGDSSEGTATIDWVALVEGERRRGLAQDAVRLFEEAAAGWGVRRFMADVEIGRGLALYFWLRLGYRPLGVERDAQGHEALRMTRAE